MSTRDFVWGVATSAYQIEGAIHADGRGASIWDRFSAEPGRIADGSDGSIACDHYNRWREDVDLLGQLGVNAYRFSIAWPRVLPEGRGSVNAAGLDFYDRLVDALRAAGIEPWVTLYHWDLPQALQNRGGWTARETVDAFAEYTQAVVGRLGDRVSRWITINEPWCASVLGHLQGEHAPGLEDPYAHLTSSHHLLLAHGRAARIIHAEGAGQAGIALNLVPGEPATDDPADVEAAERFDLWFNRWYLDPIAGRGYPRALLERYQREGYVDDWRFIQPGDEGLMGAGADLLGVNYYTRAVIQAEGAPEPGGGLTDMGWEVYPEGLEALMTRIGREYPEIPALYVTENGAAYKIGPDGDDRVADAERVGYLRGHIAATQRAIQAGAPIRGYFAWSLLDNFEWAYGYKMRFGLVWVDYATQRRIIKDSGLWYRDFITRGGTP